jgi:putative transposase
MNYERMFFITTVTRLRTPLFRQKAAAELLVETLMHYRDGGKYLLHEFVVMPDHLHAILTPTDGLSLERAMQFIKGGFSFRLGKGSIWQQSFSHDRIEDERDYEKHREYVWMNPVRAGLVQRAEDYPYSSAWQGLKPTGKVA